MFDIPEPMMVGLLTVFLFLALCGVLALVVTSLQRPRTLPLLIAGLLVVFSLLLVAIAPVNVPAIMGLILGALAVAIAVVGGNPVTRRVLAVAAGSRVRETPDGGIVVQADVEDDDSDDDDDDDAPRTLLRGGTTIGYLERIASVLAVIAGYPEAIAVIVAIKGIGRFSELAAAEARERFIIGTLSSLVWASLIGALIRLAIW